MGDQVELIVDGRRYGGWKSVRVTRSMESLAGSFALDVSDRWADQHEPWPIAEEDPCRVEINGVTVIDGYVGQRKISSTANARTLSYTGKDRAAALVENSVELAKWTHYNVDIASFASTLAEPFGVRVSVQPGLQLGKIAKLVISPGDTAYEVIRRAADQGVLFVSDGRGGMTITRAGRQRATALVEGVNIHTAEVDYDAEQRYHRYIVATQAAATDQASGNATRVRADAIDEGVRRTDRVLLIRPEKGYDLADARRRADWEARVRAARAEPVTIGVLGWTQPNGALWPINALTRVQASRMIGVAGDMLITQAEHSISEAGRITRLRLLRPDAFEPEPRARVKKPTGAGGWKELKDGAR